MPSKPFRQIERAVGDASGGAEHAHARGGHPQGDVLALILQQSMATQERADRLMAVLIDRLAQQHAAPPPPPMDPVAMMAGLATVLEKLRPGQAGDSLAQLSGLVGVMKQLSGSQPAESPADELLGAMTSMLKAAPLHSAMTPPALPQGQQSAGPAMGRGAGGPPAVPEMVWVMLPGVGPVMMRVDHAAKVVARMGAMPGAGTATAGAPAAPQPEVAQPAAMPVPQVQAAQAAQVAVIRPPEPLPMPAPAAVAPPAPPPPPAPAPPAAIPPTPAPVAPTVTTAATPPSPSSTEPASGRADRCIICGEGGRRDPSQPEVLICRNNHKSLLSAQPPRAAARPAPPAQHEIEAMLADPEVLSALSPEAIAAIRHMTTQKAHP